MSINFVLDKNFEPEPALLPCPFCDGKASLYTDTDTPSPMHCIMCSGCAIGTGWSMFKDMQITAWNRRAETETARKWKECWDRAVALGLGGIPSMIAFIEAGVPDGILNDAKYLLKELVTPHPDRVYRSALRISDYLKSLPGKKA